MVDRLANQVNGALGNGQECIVVLDSPNKDVGIDVAIFDDYGVTLELRIEEAGNG